MDPRGDFETIHHSFDPCYDYGKLFHDIVCGHPLILSDAVQCSQSNSQYKTVILENSLAQRYNDIYRLLINRTIGKFISYDQYIRSLVYAGLFLLGSVPFNLEKKVITLILDSVLHLKHIFQILKQRDSLPIVIYKSCCSVTILSDLPNCIETCEEYLLPSSDSSESKYKIIICKHPSLLGFLAGLHKNNVVKSKPDVKYFYFECFVGIKTYLSEDETYAILASRNSFVVIVAEEQSHKNFRIPIRIVRELILRNAQKKKRLIYACCGSEKK